MIQVTIFRRKDNQLAGFLSEGHAGYAEEGYDIVCSAVSALAINTANALDTLTGDDVLIEEAEDGGYLRVLLTGRISERADVLLQSLKLGLEMIVETYGHRYLTLSERQISAD